MRMPPGRVLGRYSRHVQLRRGPGGGPGPGEEVISLHWLCNASGSPSQRRGQGKERTQVKGANNGWMDAWMNGYMDGLIWMEGWMALDREALQQ